MAKRRGNSPAKGSTSKTKGKASKKAKVEDDKEKAAVDAPPKVPTITKSTTRISLPELYKLCANEEDQLLAWENRGAASQIVWPFLVEHFAAPAGEGSHRQEIQWFQACHLLALLVSLHCREGTFPASTPLSFIVQSSKDDTNGNGDKNDDNMKIMQDVLETLVHHDQKSFRFQTTVVHFVFIVNTCADTTLGVCNPGLLLWHWMPARRRELEFRRHPILAKKYSALQTKVGDDQNQAKPFVVTLLSNIVHLLEGETDGHGKRLLHLYEPRDETQDVGMENQYQKDDDNDDVDGDVSSSDVWAFVHRSLELLIDLLSSHETRQYLIVYMDSIHFTVRCRLAVGNQFAKYEPLRLAQQLLQRINRLVTLLPLETSVSVTVQHTTAGTSLKSLSLSPVDVVSLYHRRATTLQKMCHRHYPHLKDVIYAGVGLLCEGNANYLRRVFGGLQEGQLAELLNRMRLVDCTSTTSEVLEERDDEFLWNVLFDYLAVPPHPLEQLKSFPLYPTESVLWDNNLIPPTHFALRRSSPVLSLPKLNKNFLSYQDYLLRNFELVRLESAYDIRSDLVDAIKRLRPIIRQTMDVELHEDIVLKTEFRGWARMALELNDIVRIKNVHPPLLGSTLPSQVVAEFSVDLKPW